jgi:hypothetical protein
MALCVVYAFESQIDWQVGVWYSQAYGALDFMRL